MGGARELCPRSLGRIAVVVMPAVALLAGGTICWANRTAARTGGLSPQFPMNLKKRNS